VPVSCDCVGRPYFEFGLMTPEEKVAFPLLKERLYHLQKVGGMSVRASLSTLTA
jgi:hypothetical protein